MDVIEHTDVFKKNKLGHSLGLDIKTKFKKLL